MRLVFVVASVRHQAAHSLFVPFQSHLHHPAALSILANSAASQTLLRRRSLSPYHPCFAPFSGHDSGSGSPHFPTMRSKIPTPVATTTRLRMKGNTKTTVVDDETTKNPPSDAAAAAAIQRPKPASLIAAQSDEAQRLAVFAIATALVIGTGVVVSIFNGLEGLLPTGWFALWRDFTWPLPLGLIFLAAGVTHFTLRDTYTAMVPPIGTWGGLWQVPAPYNTETLKLSYAEYHTYWTGLAEVTGGLWLILAGTFGAGPVQLPAACLGLLVAAVTPANIYMATHDIVPPNLPPIPYPEGHVGRMVLQCILLALFWKLTFQ